MRALGAGQKGAPLLTRSALFAAADYNLTPRDRPKLFVQCADAPRAALLEREAGLVAALASAEQVGPGVLVSATGLGLGVGFYP